MTLVCRLLAVLFVAAPCFAQFGNLPLPGRANIEARLLLERSQTTPSDTFLVGVELEMQSGWHTYWKNPGNTGTATSVTWTLPAGVTAGPLHWPVPARFVDGEFVNFGYKDRFVLVTAIHVGPEVSGPLALQADVRWRGCKEACIPGKKSLHFELPTGDAIADSANAAHLQAAQQALPKPLEAVVERQGNALHIRHAAVGELTDFLPSSAAFNKAQLTATAAGFQIPVAEATPDRFAGVLVTAFGAYAIDAPIPQVTPISTEQKSILLLLLGAFAGGLILNLMPCVLPVISLKVMGLIEGANQEGKSALSHGFSFVAGVLLSFWGVAGILLVLRAGGAGLGWGFQMQNPLFVLILLVLLVLLALNFLGVFEFGVGLTSVVGGQRKGWGGSLMSGVLATVVATPCTAPFMGTAIAAALTTSPLQAMLIFTALGLGMGLPMFVLTAVPALLKWVPKPGPWMEQLKQLLAFPLLFTAVWLADVFIGLRGDSSVLRVMSALVLLGFGAWAYGSLVTFGASRGRKTVGWALALAALVGALAIPLGVSQAEQDWQPYSPALVNELEAAGTPYFIDFTAKWCLTCQSNKALALHRPEVRDFFEEQGIATLRADWTSQDATITKALGHYGRAGVPVYVFWAPGGATMVLPNILTPDIVMDGIRKVLAQ